MENTSKSLLPSASQNSVGVLCLLNFLASFNIWFVAGLPEDVEVEFTGPTDFSSDNETLADSLWNSLDTAGGAVALSDEYVEANGLHPAERFWWDDGKGIYYVQGFHLLHCVVRCDSLFPLPLTR